MASSAYERGRAKPIAAAEAPTIAWMVGASSFLTSIGAPVATVQREP